MNVFFCTDKCFFFSRCFDYSFFSQRSCKSKILQKHGRKALIHYQETFAYHLNISFEACSGSFQFKYFIRGRLKVPVRAKKKELN